MDLDRLAELLGTAINCVIKKAKIREEEIEDFLVIELGVEEDELDDIYSFIDETKS